MTPASTGLRFGSVRSSAPLRALIVAPFVIFVACLAMAALGVGGAAGAVALGVFGAVFVAFGIANLATGSTKKLLASLGGRPTDPSRDARLINLVDGLCFAFGLPLPRLVVVDSDAPNAIAIGRTQQTTTLVVTTSALERLGRIELEALLAHELAHVRRGDTARAALVMRAVGLVASRSDRGARLGVRLVGPEREGLADLAATAVTHYPPALADALEVLAGVGSVAPARLSPAARRLTSWQWSAPLEQPGVDARLPGELDLCERIAALREL